MKRSICQYCDEHHEGRGQNHGVCPMRDLLAQAFRTGRIHAQRGAACAVDRAAKLFGEKVAVTYVRGYFYEYGVTTF